MLKILLVASCIAFVIVQSDVVDNVKSAASDAAEKIKEGFNSAGEAIGDATDKAKQGAKDAANKVGDALNEGQSAAKEKIDEVKSKAGNHLLFSFISPFVATFISLFIVRVF